MRGFASRTTQRTKCVSAQKSTRGNGRSVLEIPGFLDAVVREQFCRDAAFLGLSETVAGYELAPLTLRHYLILRATRNPILWAGLPSPNQLFNFLWLLNPANNNSQTPEPRARAQFEAGCRKRFFPPRFLALLNCKWSRAWYRLVHRRRQLEAAKIITHVREFIDETMQDRPPKMKDRPFDADYYSDGAFFCAHFGREYGWPPEVVLALPMNCVFQFCNEIKQRNMVPGKSIPLCNPSDRVKSAWMRSLRTQKANGN